MLLLIVCLAFFFFFAFQADESSYPLLLRAATLVVPLATFSLLFLNVIYSPLTGKRKSALKTNLAKVLAIALAIIGISAMTVYFQIRWQGMAWLQTNAVEDHEYVMTGVAGNPWQFRVLAEYLIELTKVIFVQFGIGSALVVSLVFWRVFENILMLAAALLYYRQLGLKTFAAMVAIGVVGLTLSDAINGSNLALNTYFDVFFYLLAGYLIVRQGNIWWILPIVFFAALNRETSGFIPVMLLADYLYNRKKYGKSTPVVKIFVLGLLIYIAVFFGLRYMYPTEGMLIPAGQQPGLPLLLFNLERPATWIQLFTTFGIIPFLALYSFRSFPRTLKAFAVLIVPAWFVIHFFLSVISETRLLLVPYLLVFIPGVFLRATVGENGGKPDVHQLR